MLESLRIHETVGLTPQDCAVIAQLGAQLPGSWSVHFDRLDHGELFARVLAPDSDHQVSAFLVERQSTTLILTDRLSSSDQDRCSAHATAEEAVRAAHAVIMNLLELYRADTRAMN